MRWLFRSVVELDGDDAHHRLRRAARRGERAENQQQDDRRQPDEEVGDYQAAPHAPEQLALDAHGELQSVVGGGDADGEDGQNPDEAERRFAVGPRVAYEEAQDVERDRGERDARHHAPEPLARDGEPLRDALRQFPRLVAHPDTYPSSSSYFDSSRERVAPSHSFPRLISY